MKSTKKIISRKQFFKWAGIVALVPLYRLWDGSVEQKQSFSSQQSEITIDKNLPDGVHFFGKVILIKEKNAYQLLSSKCSHLGCRIDKAENGQMVCPCHGSRYDFKGEPLKGPATNPLTNLDFQIEEQGENLLIRFKF